MFDLQLRLRGSYLAANVLSSGCHSPIAMATLLGPTLRSSLKGASDTGSEASWVQQFRGSEAILEKPVTSYNYVADV